MTSGAASGRAPKPPGGTCPICRKPVAPGTETRPFCSSRCRMVDLGRWLKGEYRVPGEDAVALDIPKPESAPDDDE